MSTEIDWSGWTKEYPLWIVYNDPDNCDPDWHTEPKDDGRMYDSIGCHWSTASEKSGLITVYRKPGTSSTTWGGEGNPPLGASVTINLYDNKYLLSGDTECFVGAESTVKSVFEGKRGPMVALQLGDGYCGCFVAAMVTPFQKPLPKEEDIREDAIEDMLDITSPYYSRPRVSMGKLYDAGYRLQKDGE